MADREDLTQFVESAPLYKKESNNNSIPQNISRECATCKKETTWNRTKREPLFGNSSSDYAAVTLFKCGLCNKNEYIFVTKGIDWKDTGYQSVMKIGEWPASRPHIDNLLREMLGISADTYQRALLCRNFGLGLASLAYVRRVVEEKVKDLLETIAEAALAEGATSEVVEKIRLVKDAKEPFETKLRIASEAIPTSLRPGGANPLGLLYSLISRGIHNETEDTCLELADEIRGVFEYVFSTMRAQIEDRKRFAEKVSKWAGSTR